MKATLPNGDLSPIDKCDIVVPHSGGAYTIKMKVLPEITDTKAAQYQDEPVIGRSFPIKTYGHGENRIITMKVHFVILKNQDAQDNLQALRALQSAVYPRDSNNNPYLPPPICKIRCGKLLSGSSQDGYLCVVLKQYSVDFPTDVAWYQSPQGGQSDTYLPYKFDVSLTWDVVYTNSKLPGQDMIFGDI